MLKSVELNGFKSFGRKVELVFMSPIAAIVGPNGSGKCVTSDTLLWRRGAFDDVYSVVRIDRVKAGDIVASYDEQSGMVVPRVVKARVAQGVREVFHIITEGGRSIRATGNHPFLVQDTLIEAKNLHAGSVLSVRKSPKMRVGLFIDGANLYHTERKTGWDVDINKLKQALAEVGEIVCAHHHIAVPRDDDATYERAMKYVGRLERLVTVKQKLLTYVIDQETGVPSKKGDVDVELVIDVIERMDTFDVAVVVSGDSDYLELERFLREHGKGIVFLASRRTIAWELRLKKHVLFEEIRTLIERGGMSQNQNPRLAPGALLLQTIVREAHMLSSGPARMGAVDNDSIAQIHLEDPQEVWDVEIEGTHTFIANDIVVHNSNVAEGLRFVLGEQSMKSLRSKRGEDLIWGGSHALPRTNRASVKVVFDNSARRLDIDFPEVILERVVYRDGQNEYLMNGTKVRLKDVIRLLAGANIGGSGYQIISQGEADRILNASPRERREMVEDALGLKLYQHKKAESERKLEETRENIEKVESLRRELAPHLKFLYKQVEKVEKAKELKEDLAAKLADYLAREHAWIAAEDARLKDEEAAHRAELSKARADIAEARGTKEKANLEEESAFAKEIARLEQELRYVRTARGELARELGRAEGALEAAQSMPESAETAMSRREAGEFAQAMEDGLNEALSSDTLEKVRAVLGRVQHKVRNFLTIVQLGGDNPGDSTRERRQRAEELAKELSIAEKKEANALGQIREAREREHTAREALHTAERSLLTLESKVRELEARLTHVGHARSDVARAREQFEMEVREGIALIGAAVHAWDKNNVPDGALSEDRREQEKRRRDIERLKIKIEEYGGGDTGDDVLKEYNQTRERDEFLGRELGDLAQSEQNLRQIIEELDAKMDERFTEGLEKINTALQVFFGRLFGGGSAKLELEKPIREKVAKDDFDGEEENDGHPMSIIEEEPVAGLAVSVSLPRKKVRGLEVLSGGERALTSIAMIFAMSQVNPPPFLILDETDAALDEANSKRYADMIRKLAERSQLILITHNRATMSAAGELYGVTMGQDGVSKLLSVKLEEAERVAK